MRIDWSLLITAAVLSAAAGCSKGLHVAPDAGGAEAGPGLGIDAGAQAIAAEYPDLGTDAANTPEAGVADAPASLGDSSSDTTYVVWPGPDATVTIGAAPAVSDGGIYPQIYVFPGLALASHSNMFAAEPDLSFRVDELGDFQYVDLNSDGLGDIVISYGTNVSFHLQQRNGTFQRIPGITLQKGDSSRHIAIADFNRDGLADLAMVHFSGLPGYRHGIAIYLQTNDGFHNTPDQEITTVVDTHVSCDDTYFLAACDMNGDLRTDLVALTQVDHSFGPGPECAHDTAVAQVFLQGADGAFALATSISPRSIDAICHACAVSLATGDFNSDGHNDMAVIQYGQLNLRNADWVGREVLTYPTSNGSFATAPAQVLTVSQYLKAVSFVDVNADGKLDILARSADWTPHEPDIQAAGFMPGLTGVFLQKDDGSFEKVRTITPDGWLPADTNEKLDPIGIDVRDIDHDGVGDLVLERKSAPEGLFRQEHGLFSTTPDVEVQGVLADWVRGAKERVSVTYAIDRSTAAVAGRFNALSYAMADMNGDGRPDIIAAYQPFAPTLSPDPMTGVYPSYPGVYPHTYTLFRVYLQRPITRRFVVEIQESSVLVDEKVLRVQATLHNLSGSAAENVRVRLLAASSPVLLQTTLGILAGGPDAMMAFGADWVDREERQVRGEPLGPDILIPRIEADAIIPMTIEVPVALVPDLDVRCLFLLVDPDENTNVILKRKYDFISPNRL